MPLSRDSVEPLHRRVYESVRSAILDGRLRSGEKLPSTRAMADQMGVARITVARAYDDLAAGGYVEGRRGSGTFVAHAVGRPSEPEARPWRLSGWARRALGDAPASPEVLKELPYDFRPGTPDWDAFPRRIWWRLVGRRLRAGGALDRYGDPAGYPPLREAIARHLATSRAVVCRAEQVVVVNGTQQTIDLLARLLLEPGDGVVVEDPGYREARLLFSAYGAALRPVAVDRYGLRTAELREAARFVYVTPSHQFPTGVTLTLERRLQLLEWAERHDALVLEDDYDSELRYDGPPVEALQALDRSSRVVYMGTFSTALFPPLRVGYAVLPAGLVEPFARAKWLADRGTGLLEQQALADFLTEGHFSRHLRRMRRLGRGRRDALLRALDSSFGARARVLAAQTGMHVMVRLDGIDAVRLAEDARTRGVGVYPVDGSALLLGFGALDEPAIGRGIRLLAELAA